MLSVKKRFVKCIFKIKFLIKVKINREVLKNVVPLQRRLRRTAVRLYRTSM